MTEKTSDEQAQELLSTLVKRLDKGEKQFLHNAIERAAEERLTLGPSDRLALGEVVDGNLDAEHKQAAIQKLMDDARERELEKLTAAYSDEQRAANESFQAQFQDEGLTLDTRTQLKVARTIAREESGDERFQEINDHLRQARSDAQMESHATQQESTRRQEAKLRAKHDAPVGGQEADAASQGEMSDIRQETKDSKREILMRNLSTEGSQAENTNTNDNSRGRSS